jgi:hypothetical protein
MLQKSGRKEIEFFEGIEKAGIPFKGIPAFNLPFLNFHDDG